MTVKDRGFGTMKKRDPRRLADISSEAGKKNHELGRAHEFTQAESKHANRLRRRKAR